jgi:hypothetical protein
MAKISIGVAAPILAFEQNEDYATFKFPPPSLRHPSAAATFTQERISNCDRAWAAKETYREGSASYRVS